MGRGKPPMELIKNEKTRNSTFHKRKLGLKKKLEEFKILCGVDVCMILYGPSCNNKDGKKQNHGGVELDIFPEKPEDVKQVLARCKTTEDDQQPITCRNHDLSDYYHDRARKIQGDVSKTRRAAYKAKYPGWDDRLLNASADQLMEILSLVDGKIEFVHLSSEIAKQKQQQQFAMASNHNGLAFKMIGCNDVLSAHPQSYPTDSDVYQQHQVHTHQLEGNHNNGQFDLNAFNQFSFDHGYAQALPYMPLPWNYFDPASGLFEATMNNTNNFDQMGNFCTGYDSEPAMFDQKIENESNMTSNASDVMLSAAIHSRGGNEVHVNERVYNFDDLLMLN